MKQKQPPPEEYTCLSNKLDILYSKYHAFLDILNRYSFQNLNHSKMSHQYALQILYFLHCGYVRLVDNSTFVPFEDKDSRDVENDEFKNITFSTYVVPRNVSLDYADFFNKIEVLNLDTLKKINDISYLGLETKISRSQLTKIFKYKLVDRLHDLDNQHCMDNHIWQVGVIL